MKYNNTKQERKRKQREREAKQKQQKQQQQQQQQKTCEIPIDCPSDIKSLNKHYNPKLYRKIALKYHPDKCKYDSNKWMVLINNIRDFKLKQQ